MTGQFAQEHQELFTTVRCKFPITIVIPCTPLLVIMPVHLPCTTVVTVYVISDTQLRKMIIGT